MVRTIKESKHRALKKDERAVFLPGADATWERWILKPSGEPERVAVLSDLQRASRKGALAIPVRHALAIPLWLNQTDPKQVAEMIPLQLELRDISLRQNSTQAIGWQIIDVVPPRSLVMVGVLGKDLPEDIAGSSFADYDLSVRYRSFSEDSITLWLEHEFLCVAVTRGSHIVYFQVLPDATITQRVLQDLRCIRASLEMESLIGKLREIVVWFDPQGTESTNLQTSLYLPVKKTALPSPRWPGRSWALTPPSVVESKRAAQKRKWIFWGGMLVLLIYLIVAAVMLTQMFITQSRIKELEAWTSANQDEIDRIQHTQAVWKDLAQVVNPQTYPMELLLHSSESIPNNSLHLTLFHYVPKELNITGEAKDAASAFQFREALLKSPAFKNYTWDNVEPTILPNDLARFTLHATHATAQP